MDGGSGVTAATAVNMAEILELGGARYKILDEVARTPRHPTRHRNEGDSVSTKPYSEARHDYSSDHRVDLMERRLSDLVNRLDDMMVSRDAGHRQRPPLAPDFPRSQESFVRDYLHRERLEIPPQDGKQDLSDFFVRNPIPKPYMFLQKTGLTCAKKKLDYRQNMTAAEYTQAFIALLCDSRARDPSTLLQQLRHLKDVAHDINQFAWPAVRAWSQGVFDAVERGAFTWDDTQMIQNERFMALRASVMDSRPGDAHEGKETICLDYNNRTCRHGGAKRDHSEAGIRFIHCCLYCYASSRDRLRCDHGLVDCKRKEKHNSHVPMHPNQVQYGLAPPPIMNQYGRPRFNPPAAAVQQQPQQQHAHQFANHNAYQPAAVAPPKNL